MIMLSLWSRKSLRVVPFRLLPRHPNSAERAFRSPTSKEHLSDKLTSNSLWLNGLLRKLTGVAYRAVMYKGSDLPRTHTATEMRRWRSTVSFLTKRCLTELLTSKTAPGPDSSAGKPYCTKPGKKCCCPWRSLVSWMERTLTCENCCTISVYRLPSPFALM